MTATTVYQYDEAGNLKQTTDGDGRLAKYTYDALDRVTTTIYPANTAENVTYNYEEANHDFGVGRLTSLAGPAGTLSYNYDERGNVTAEALIRNTTTATAFNYDAAGHVASIIYPSGWTLSYTRNGMGRATGLSLQAPNNGVTLPVVSNIAYQPFGPVNSLKFGNGITETRTYDLDYHA